MSNYAYAPASLTNLRQPTPAHTWLDNVSDEYAAKVQQWVYARDHYTGECTAPWKVPAYLVRKKIGETVEAYEERVLLADYTPYFGAVVDTLAGMLAQTEPDTTRTYGALGAPDDPASVIGRLWIDADGSGLDWRTLFGSQLTTDLVAVHDAWVLVDGGPDGLTPHARLVPAEAITNWRYEDGVLVEVLLKEVTDTRASIHDDPDEKAQEQWVEFRVDGWTRWRKKRDAQARTEVPEALAEGTYEYKTRAGRPTVPLICVHLPLRRNVGWLMARKANAIFNLESVRDHLLRFATFPFMNLVANDNAYKKLVEQIRQGARVLQQVPGNAPHSFIAPESAPASILNQTIGQKEAAYYETAFREFGASAQRAKRDRVTATEIKQDVAAGVAAFLGLLKAAVDGAENAAFYLLEQTVLPRDPGKWGGAHVERSNDFAPFDINAIMERLRTRYFGPQATFPIGRTALIEAVKQAASWDGLPVDEAEIGAAVDKFIAVQNAPPAPPTPRAVTVTTQPSGKPAGTPP